MDPRVRLAQARHTFGEFGGVNPSVEISTTFTVLDPKSMPEIFSGERGPDRGGCYVYGRSFNPTVRALGRQLAALEDTEAGYATSSGMAAISCTLMSLCNSGDHIVASNTIYGGSFALLKSFLPQKAGVATTFVDITDHAAVRAALQTANTKVLYTESLANPTLQVADIPALAELAHAAGATLVVDNTFTPCIISPARLGADVVVHSLTKFISGSSDIIAGAILGPASFLDGLMDFHTGALMLLGPTMDPKIAGELILRLPHLACRMQEHSRRALAFAERLQALGARVVYPGLPGHAQHELFARLASPGGYGFGGLMGLDMGSAARAEMLMERLQNKHAFGFMAVSLGNADTLMSLSGASTSSELSEEEKEAAGISGGYVRMSVGITGTLEQRWEQLRDSYQFVQCVAEANPTGQAPFKATRVRRDADGGVTVLESWPSLGPGNGEEGAVDAAVAAAAAAAALPAGATAETPSFSAALAYEQGLAQQQAAAAKAAAAANGTPGGRVKRRGTDHEVVYTPVGGAQPIGPAAS